MGGYGAYVWTAYGITALGLVLLLIWAWFGARARESELDQVRQWARAERQTPSAANPGQRPSDPETRSSGRADARTAPVQASGGGANE
jgi:heme exporter protein CcmD